MSTGGTYLEFSRDPRDQGQVGGAAPKGLKFILYSFLGMVGEACLPSNAYYPRTPDYTLCSGVHVCWSEHSDSSFVYGFMILDYGFGTMTATTLYQHSHVAYQIEGYEE